MNGWLTYILNLLGMGAGGSTPTTPGGQIAGMLTIFPRVTGTITIRPRVSGTVTVQPRVTGSITIGE